MVDLMDGLLDAFDGGSVGQVAFCDLGRAFDTMDHRILLDKLEIYGIRRFVEDLMKSYLANRKQFVVACGESSGMREVACGVPQGSILGPLLFIIYINDLVPSITSDAVCLFADDSSIVNYGKTIEEVSQKTRASIEEARKWFSCNKLKLNDNKTQVVTFSVSSSAEKAGVTSKRLLNIFS